MEDVAGTVADLVKQGKARFFGMSEAGVANIRRAHAVHPVSVLQSEYSLWERNLEAELIPALRELGIGLVPFAPLGRGFLTGEVKRAEDYPANDHRHSDPRYQGKNYDANMQAAKAVADIAANKGATPAQIALAWLLHKGGDIVPIPGTKRRKYLEENVAAADVRLDPADMTALDDALSPARIAGARYNEHQDGEHRPLSRSTGRRRRQTLWLTRPPTREICAAPSTTIRIPSSGIACALRRCRWFPRSASTPRIRQAACGGSAGSRGRAPARRPTGAINGRAAWRWPATFSTGRRLSPASACSTSAPARASSRLPPPWRVQAR